MLTHVLDRQHNTCIDHFIARSNLCSLIRKLVWYAKSEQVFISTGKRTVPTMQDMCYAVTLVRGFTVTLQTAILASTVVSSNAAKS